jgi:hypothetical protein
MISRIVRADGTTELTGIKSVTYTEKVNADVDLRPGCVASASIEVVAYGSQSDAPAAGEALTYYQTGNDGVEHLIGIFYAEPSVPSKATYAFTAYDAVSKLDVDFSSWLNANQSNFPMTVYSIVSAACTVAGVTLGSASWPLSTQTVQAFYADGLTCRQILQYAAEIGCRFVRCNASGQVVFDWYSVASNYRIYPSGGQNETETYVAYKESGLNYANYTTAALARVAVHPGGEEQVAYIYPDGVTSGNTLHIQNNLLLTGADSTVYTAVAQNVYTAMSALGQYRPMTVELFPGENPLRAGQVVPVTDIQGVDFSTVLMGMTVTDASARLESTGNESYSDYALEIEKAIAQLASDIVRINKLKVDWAEIDTAIIQTLEAEGINADEISITGTLHSSDYIRNATSTYADRGMGIELDAGETRIATQNFAVTPNGYIYAQNGYIAGAKLARGQAYNYATTPAGFVDTDGQTSTAYEYTQSTNTTVVSANGTLKYNVPLTVSSGAYEISKIWVQVVSGGNDTEERKTPAGRIYYLSSSDVVLNTADFSALRYVASGSSLGQNFTFSQDWLTEATSIRVEIDVANGDICRFQRRYGLYTAIYYGGTGKLAGDPDGVYYGSDGISVGENIILTPDGHISGTSVTSETIETGMETLSSTNITDDMPSPSSMVYGNGILFRDPNGFSLGVLRPYVNPNGEQGVFLSARRTVNGAVVTNYLGIRVGSDGALYVSVSSPQAWRTALSAASQAEVDECRPTKGTVADGTNLNTLQTNGVYFLSGARTYTNMPSGVSYGVLTVNVASSGGFVYQALHVGGTYRARVFGRIYVNSEWTMWVEFTAQRGQMTDGTNLNSVLVSGVYQLSGSHTYSNLPSGVQWGVLTVSNTGSSFAAQEIVTSGGATHKRVYTGSAWSAWKAL